MKRQMNLTRQTLYNSRIIIITGNHTAKNIFNLIVAPNCVIVVKLTDYDNPIELHWPQQMFFNVLLFQVGWLESSSIKSSKLRSEPQIALPTVQRYDSNKVILSNNQ